MPRSEEPSQADLALEIETLDVDLYRSVRLWKPQDGRGVFGGQTMGQAVWAATNTVDSAYKLHSMHCYFLSFGDAYNPNGILYSVSRLRTGRSYATRYVNAIQNGKTIFALMCSYHVPEPSQSLSHQLPLPPMVLTRLGLASLTDPSSQFFDWRAAGIPAPEDCLNRESVLEREINAPGISEKMKQFLEKAIEHAKANSVEFRNVEQDSMEHARSGERVPWRLQWVKTRVPIKGDQAFQKCVLTYISDTQFIGNVARAYGIGPGARNGRIAMMASLDHTLHFYEDVDVSEWMLFYAEVMRGGNGRGLVHGRYYRLDGKLAVTASQEGVVRVHL